MSEALATQTTFDYSALDDDVRREVITERNDIRRRQRQAAEDIVAIGKSLIVVKSRLAHGQFGPWLNAEFGWSQDTAGRFMAVAKTFGENPQIAEIAPSALYALASNSVPQGLRDQFLERAERGEQVTHFQVKEAIKSQVEPRSFSVTYAPQENIEPRSISATYAPREEERPSSPPLLSIVDLETGEVVDSEEEDGEGANAPDSRTLRWAIPSTSRRREVDEWKSSAQGDEWAAAMNAHTVLRHSRDDILRHLQSGYMKHIAFEELEPKTQAEWRKAAALAQEIVDVIDQHISPQRLEDRV